MTHTSPEDLVTITIEGLGFRGEGYAQVQPGRFISVPHTLPGDRVVVRPGPWRRGRAWAEIVTWVTRAPEHSPPACPHYDRCSGCALRHLSPDHERQWKLDALRQILERYGPEGVASEIPIDWIDQGVRHDHRVRGKFHVEFQGDVMAVGLRGLTNTPAIVDIRDCPAQAPRFRAIMLALAERLEHEPAARAVDQIALWTDAHHNKARIVLHLHPEPLAGARAALEALLAQMSDPDLTASFADGEVPPFPSTAAPGITVDVSPDSWVHATPHVAAQMVEWVTGRLGGEAHASVLDLCCGAGTVTFALAQVDEIKHIISVDEDHRACQALGIAAKRSGAHIEVRAGRVGQVLRKLRRELIGGVHPTGAVINPMRRPLGRAQLRDLAPLGVRHVIYLGPSPVSTARDARTLTELGFTVTSGAGVNLHPATGQVMLALEFRHEEGTS